MLPGRERQVGAVTPAVACQDTPAEMTFMRMYMYVQHICSAYMSMYIQHILYVHICSAHMFIYSMFISV